MRIWRQRVRRLPGSGQTERASCITGCLAVRSLNCIYIAKNFIVIYYQLFV
jgi:hypothetical protein